MYEQDRFNHEDSSIRHANKQVENLTYRMSYRDILPAREQIEVASVCMPFVIVENGSLAVALKEVR